MTTIVVEGIGDIVSKPFGYGRALEKLKIDDPNLQVIFTDIKENWYKSPDTNIAKEREEAIARFTKWGAKFIDKTPTNVQEYKEYQGLLNANIDAVFIAVPDRFHITVAKHWLSGNCKRIFIEKPLTNDKKEAQVWLSQLTDEDQKRLVAFDHYLAKVHAQFQYAKHIEMMWRSIGRPKNFKFYFLEDHSGTDQNYLQEVERKGRINKNGPIENEGRMDALQEGLILDLMPHILAVLIYFGHPQTIKVTEIRAAKYTGVDFDYNKPAGIKGETFAAIKFTFLDNNKKEVNGEAYVGKGIRGSKKYRSMDGNVKVLEIKGHSRARDGVIEFDFNNSVATEVKEKAQEPEPIFDLEHDPYYYLVRDVVFRKLYRGTALGMPVATGNLILDKIITEITSRINYESLPLYNLGNKEGKLPPLLEDLLPGGNQEVPSLDMDETTNI
jgi:predicted dehydrogenase